MAEDAATSVDALWGGDAPSVLVVGDGDEQRDAFVAALVQLGVETDLTPLEVCDRAASLVAPDAIILVGDAAADDGRRALGLLGRSALTAVVPAIVLLEDDSVERRVSALGNRAKAVVARGADADATALQIANVLRSLRDPDALLHDEAGRLDPLGADDGPVPGSSDLAGARVLLADDDPERAEVVGEALARKGATVSIVGLDGSGIEDAEEADPQALIVGEDVLEGQRFDLVRKLRAHLRLRWAHMILVRWDEVLPSAGGRPDTTTLTRRIARALEPERTIAARLATGDPFDIRIEALGPARLVRALAGAIQPTRASCTHVRATLHVDVFESLVLAARANRPYSGVREGTAALARWLGIASGRVRILPLMAPDAPNIMMPIEEALAVASHERTSLPPEAAKAAALDPDEPFPVASARTVAPPSMAGARMPKASPFAAPAPPGPPGRAARGSPLSPFSMPPPARTPKRTIVGLAPPPPSQLAAGRPAPEAAPAPKTREPRRPVEGTRDDVPASAAEALILTATVHGSGAESDPEDAVTAPVRLPEAHPGTTPILAPEREAPTRKKGRPATEPYQTESPYVLPSRGESRPQAPFSSAPPPPPRMSSAPPPPPARARSAPPPPPDRPRSVPPPPPDRPRSVPPPTPRADLAPQPSARSSSFPPPLPSRASPSTHRAMSSAPPPPPRMSSAPPPPPRPSSAPPPAPQRASMSSAPPMGRVSSRPPPSDSPPVPMFQPAPPLPMRPSEKSVGVSTIEIPPPEPRRRALLPLAIVAFVLLLASGAAAVWILFYANTEPVVATASEPTAPPSGSEEPLATPRPSEPPHTATAPRDPAEAADAGAASAQAAEEADAEQASDPRATTPSESTPAAEEGFSPPDWVSRVNRRTKARRVKQLSLVGRRALRRRQHERALSAYQRAWWFDQRNAATASAIAQSFDGAGNEDFAIHWARRAVELEPNVAAHRVTLAALLDEANQDREALAEYREALRIQPRNRVARRAVARLQRSTRSPRARR